MKKYVIFYRGRAVKTTNAYTDGEARSKAAYWYNRACKDTNKDKKQLRVLTPYGQTLKVF